jgi:hypothetical protein
MEILMTAEEKNSEAWFFKLLKKAGDLEVSRILDSDEAFESFLKNNPLTPEEEDGLRGMIDRLSARLTHQPLPTAPACETAAEYKDEEAFAALHRNQGPTSAETQAKLEECRRRAKQVAGKRKRSKKSRGAGDNE